MTARDLGDIHLLHMDKYSFLGRRAQPVGDDGEVTPARHCEGSAGEWMAQGES